MLHTCKAVLLAGCFSTNFFNACSVKILISLSMLQNKYKSSVFQNIILCFKILFCFSKRITCAQRYENQATREILHRLQPMAVYADFSFFDEDLTFLMISPGRCRRCRMEWSRIDRSIQEDTNCGRCLLPGHNQSFSESFQAMHP